MALLDVVVFGIDDVVVFGAETTESTTDLEGSAALTKPCKIRTQQRR